MPSFGVPKTALRDLREAVGESNVVDDPAVLSEYERATFATQQRVPLLLFPGSTADVQSVVRIANRHRIQLYPVSRGRNWGLGSRVPVRTNNCVVDLKRMNRIVHFDEKDAVLTIEPGVTFEQVDKFLRERKSDLYLAVTGGPPDSSVLANALERGDGIGPIGDRAKYCCGLEVVLPSGECIHTGLEPFENSLTGKIAQFGLGPAVEGLFFQSNFGIVTRMNVWLTRRPRSFQLVVFAAEKDDDVTAATEAIRELQRRGIVGDTAYVLWNVYRLITTQIKYPWDETRQTLLSPRDLLERLPRAWKGIRWIGFVGVYSASSLHALADRWMIRSALRGKVSRLFILNAVGARIGRWLARPLRKLTGVDVRKMLDTLYFNSVFVGHPTKMETSSVYWRKRGPAPSIVDPDRDRCGLHWICVSLPYDGVHVARMTRIVEEVALRHCFEPLCMYFSMSQWYMKSFIVIMFDQDVPGEDTAARRCHDEILERLTLSGYPPVRLGIQSMCLAAPTEQSYVDLIERLKRMLDPNDVLAPGRYDFRHRWSPSFVEDGTSDRSMRDMSRGKVQS